MFAREDMPGNPLGVPCPAKLGHHSVGTGVNPEPVLAWVQKPQVLPKKLTIIEMWNAAVEAEMVKCRSSQYCGRRLARGLNTV